jgi:hypothetical protein
MPKAGSVCGSRTASSAGSTRWSGLVSPSIPHCCSGLSDGVLSGLFRSTNVLEHYRAFTIPEGEKFRAYLGRLFAHPAFKGTCSDEKLYLDSYERLVILT